MNVLTKIENNPCKITDVKALTEHVRPAAHPTNRTLGQQQYPGPLKAGG